MPQQVRSPADPRLIDTHGPKWVLKVVNILRGREGGETDQLESVEYTVGVLDPGHG